MSIEYNDYLKRHIANVSKSLHWMQDNLDLKALNIDADDLTDAILESTYHDHSKYGANEYSAYDAYFYGGNVSYAVRLSFDYAWLHHQKTNPHHWQYWLLVNDDPMTESAQIVPLEIPVRYVVEMIADWWSFSWEKDNLTEIFEWYDRHKTRMMLHDKTRKLVEKILNAMHRKLVTQELGT